MIDDFHMLPFIFHFEKMNVRYIFNSEKKWRFVASSRFSPNSEPSFSLLVSLKADIS